MQKNITSKENHRQSEKRFRIVFENAPMGIAIADLDGKFIEVNHAFYNMLGYSKSEVKHLSFFNITHPDDRKDTQRLSEEVRSGKCDSYMQEKRYLSKDGRVVWAVVRATGVRDNNGNIAYWLNRPLQFNPETEEILGDPEAARWLERPMREPWVL